MDLQAEGANRPLFISLKKETKAPVRASVFNNWQTIADGWYFVAQASEVPHGGVKVYEFCGDKIAVWRSQSGRLFANQAHCPHMGTSFGIGKVVGENLQCFFHKWEFSGKGRCEKIPCQTAIPSAAKLKTYKVAEKYGAIWVYSSENPVSPEPADFEELRDQPLSYKFGKPYLRACHHHVTMINGIDPQHLKTVHGLDIDMSVEIDENGSQLLDISLSGQIGTRSFRERFARKLLGPIYSYSMRYDHGNIGFLTLVKNMRWFGRGPRLPELNMIFAYRPLTEGKTLVQPIYVTKKRSGIWGWLKERILLSFTQRAFFALQGEDGLVYENMKFSPKCLLPIDYPVAEFIRYVNRLPARTISPR